MSAISKNKETPQVNSSSPLENGIVRDCDGKVCIHIDGYWIRYYAPPANTMAEKRDLIQSLQRRVFHHTEEGINSPGWRLEIARQYYENETNPARKRVNAAMLAGSLFNRASEIFTGVAKLEENGIYVDSDNALMRECEACFVEALELGKQVKHFSGEEGVDELWGEPFKAFSYPMDKFFESRYIKLAQTFSSIDQIIDRMSAVFSAVDGFEGVLPMLEELREASKTEVETMRRDEAIYEVWPRYVAAKEAIVEFKPCGISGREDNLRYWEDGMRLLHMGKDVISFLSGVRVPMPLTTSNYMANCDLYEQNGSLDSEFSIPKDCLI